jgi:hypothetical protein
MKKISFYETPDGIDWQLPVSILYEPGDRTRQFTDVSIYKSICLIHVLKEQLGDILFISFVIASGEAIIFYFEWIV